MGKIEQVVTQQTKDEIKFIRSIGTNSQATKNKSRAELLRGYLEGCRKRACWDGIDRDTAIATAEAELAKSALA